MMPAATCLPCLNGVHETAGYIIVGSICERINFWSFILCELFVGGILYPVFGCWVWGGGWMSQLGSTMNLGHGYVDFAGSTVVHAVGASARWRFGVLGPQLASSAPMVKLGHSPHNLVYVVTGTFILLFGWMGFNQVRHWAQRTCAFRSSRSIPIWRRSPEPQPRCWSGIRCLASRISPWLVTEC